MQFIYDIMHFCTLPFIRFLQVRCFVKSGSWQADVIDSNCLLLQWHLRLFGQAWFTGLRFTSMRQRVKIHLQERCLQFAGCIPAVYYQLRVPVIRRPSTIRLAGSSCNCFNLKLQGVFIWCGLIQTGYWSSLVTSFIFFQEFRVESITFGLQLMCYFLLQLQSRFSRQSFPNNAKRDGLLT